MIRRMDLKQNARLAGCLYFCAFLTGTFSLIYVPAHIIVNDDPAATIRNILEYNLLFRAGIAVELLGHAIFLLLPLALYKLLSPVDKTAAVAMVALGVMSVPLDFVINVHKLDVLTLLGEPNYLPAQVMQSLAAYYNGILVCKVFWGLWLLPFGYLVFKSGFLPRTLGVLLMLGCAGYLIDFTGSILFPAYGDFAYARFIRMPAALGELGICLWMLILGAKVRTTAAA